MHPNDVPPLPVDGDPTDQGWKLEDFWPKEEKPRVPEYLPSEVVRPYLAAERNFRLAGMEEAAAGSYGRALDVATKLLVPNFKGMLFARINHLAAEGRLTKDLADWAHHIRSVRNDALHEVESMDRDELTAVRGFSELVLTYLFTLPGMLKARKPDMDGQG